MSAKILDQALERFKLAADAESDQRDREEKALKFQVPELQWPDEAREQRQGGTIGNVPLPPRPMLSIPKLDQPIQLILNAERAANLGVQIHPLSEDADTDTAEMLQALYRRIEVDSRANLARSWAFERAVKCGRGFYRILTELDPTAPEGTNDQRIRIKRLLHQESAYLDPFAEEPDWSDAGWGFVTQWVPWSRYTTTKKYQTRKNDDKSSTSFDLWGYDDALLDALGLERPEWVTGTGEGRAVLIAEYFAKNEDGTITWRKLNAIEVLDEKPWPGKYIPIIPVVGRELIPFDSDRRYVGIIEPNMDAQRFSNYAASGVAETLGTEPKNTWVLAEGQEEGHEQEFYFANVRNFPYVRYKPTALGGNLNPPPIRQQADTSKLTLGLQALAMSDDFIHNGTGAFEPTLGQDRGGHGNSGRKVLALQQQHEHGNSNWLDNLAEISLQHEACVVLDLMLGDKKTGRVGVYDRPGRIARTLDLEDNHDRVMLNQPFVRGPQGTLTPIQPGQPGQPPQLPQGKTPDDVEHYDLANGAQYAVTVSVGKAYKSRLEEGNDQLGQLFQAEPELFKILGDIWLNFQTWPGHKAAADRMKKLLPPPLQDENEQNIAQQAQHMAQENQQLKQQLQELGGKMGPAIVKAKADVQIAQSRDQAMLAKTQADNETKLAVAELGAKMDRLSLFLEERARLGIQTHEGLMQAHSESNDAAQAALEHQRQLQAGAQNHQQTLEQGDQAQAGAMAQQQQAADLAPPPESAGA